ncbi:MAG: hypothetical protein EHM13_13715 [Acidobacteria bacterium]|nr:MAG: hypothetical protein EHM13_13715 [Acidobacteriota bacterium]
MFGGKQVPLAPRAVFFTRLFRSLALSVALISLSLAVGVTGYHWIAGLSWIDAFLNASMILGGMGPVNELTWNASKIFAACYALFSGLVLVATTGLVLGPILHRMLHKFHLYDAEDADGNGQKR